MYKYYLILYFILGLLLYYIYYSYNQKLIEGLDLGKIPNGKRIIFKIIDINLDEPSKKLLNSTFSLELNKDGDHYILTNPERVYGNINLNNMLKPNTNQALMIDVNSDISGLRINLNNLSYFLYSPLINKSKFKDNNIIIFHSNLTENEYTNNQAYETTTYGPQLTRSLASDTCEGRCDKSAGEECKSDGYTVMSNAAYYDYDVDGNGDISLAEYTQIHTQYGADPPTEDAWKSLVNATEVDGRRRQSLYSCKVERIQDGEYHPLDDPPPRIQDEVANSFYITLEIIGIKYNNDFLINKSKILKYIYQQFINF